MTWTFWKLCREADERNRKRALLARPVPPQPRFAQSTIDATKWLRRYHPERLADWYARHDPGLRRYIEETSTIHKDQSL